MIHAAPCRWGGSWWLGVLPLYSRERVPYHGGVIPHTRLIIISALTVSLLQSSRAESEVLSPSQWSPSSASTTKADGQIRYEGDVVFQYGPVYGNASKLIIVGARFLADDVAMGIGEIVVVADRCEGTAERWSCVDADVLRLGQRVTGAFAMIDVERGVVHVTDDVRVSVPYEEDSPYTERISAPELVPR